MSLVTQLASLALKGAAQAASQASGVAALAVGVERTAELLTQRFRDNSARLDRALGRSLAQRFGDPTSRVVLHLVG